MNILLLSLLESVLGSSKHTSGENYTFKCINPNCSSHQKNKKKLEISLDSKYQKNQYHCWSCGLKGSNLSYLFREKDVDYSKIEQLEKFVKLPSVQKQQTPLYKLKLPKEFIFLGDISQYKKDTYQYKRLTTALKYLKSRNINKKQIYTYHIGFCTEGYYSDRVIVPSYDKDNNLINYTARLIYEDLNRPPYLKPSGIDENIINFENLIDFTKPIYICEGSFDAIAIGDNALPLFGKRVSNLLLEKLYSQEVDNIYICLDKDAHKISIALTKQLLDMYKKVYFVQMKDKDPSKMGSDAIRELIKNTELTDFKQYIKIKQKMLN